LASLTLPACASQANRDQAGHQRRMAPPPSLACNRNQVTSFNGAVTEYKRDARSLVITIHTDWNTVETLSLRFSNPEEPLQNLMLNGRAFTKDDWPKIEKTTGALRDGMRAIAWVCINDDDLDVIDWRPGSTPE
jgi:hypothetical protein